MFGKVGVIGQSEAGYHVFGNIAGADKVYLGLDYRIGYCSLIAVAVGQIALE